LSFPHEQNRILFLLIPYNWSEHPLVTK
jgi:hypothetical protein